MTNYRKITFVVLLALASVFCLVHCTSAADSSPKGKSTIYAIKLTQAGEQYQEFYESLQEVFLNSGNLQIDNMLKELGKCEVKRDEKQGEEILLSNAKNGDVYAQLYLFYYYLMKSKSDLIYKNEFAKKSAYWIEKANETQNAIAQTFYALVVFGNNSGDISLKQKSKLTNEDAIAILKNLYERDFYFSNYVLSRVYRNDNIVPHNYALSVELLEYVAKKGYTLAQLDLADLYNYGKYVEKDTDLALAWYEKLAENGNRKAIKKAADIYFGKKDYIGYCEKWISIFKLGEFKPLDLYDIKKKIEFVNNDFSAALAYGGYFIKLLEMTSNAESDVVRKDALKVLGDIYLDGRMVDKNVNKAIEYYKASASVDDGFNSRDAESKLGIMYYDGKEVEKTIERQSSGSSRPITGLVRKMPY